jgi:hypothetical protein
MLAIFNLKSEVLSRFNVRAFIIMMTTVIDLEDTLDVNLRCTIFQAIDLVLNHNDNGILRFCHDYMSSYCDEIINIFCESLSEDFSDPNREPSYEKLRIIRENSLIPTYRNKFIQFCINFDCFFVNRSLIIDLFHLLEKYILKFVNNVFYHLTNVSLQSLLI